MAFSKDKFYQAMPNASKVKFLEDLVARADANAEFWRQKVLECGKHLPEGAFDGVVLEDPLHADALPLKIPELLGKHMAKAAVRKR